MFGREVAHGSDGASGGDASLHRDSGQLVDAEHGRTPRALGVRDELTTARALADAELLLVHDAVVTLGVRVRVVHLRDLAYRFGPLGIRRDAPTGEVRLAPRGPDEARIILKVRPHVPERAGGMVRRGNERQPGVRVAIAVVRVGYEQGPIHRSALTDEEGTASLDLGRLQRRDDDDRNERGRLRGARYHIIERVYLVRCWV